MPYVLKRGPLYVSRPGMVSSYTPKEEHARLFDTIAAAERERCVENESVVWLSVPAGHIPGTPWRNIG